MFVLLTLHILHIYQPNLSLDHLEFHFSENILQSALSFLDGQANLLE